MHDYSYFEMKKKCLIISEIGQGCFITVYCFLGTEIHILYEIVIGIVKEQYKSGILSNDYESPYNKVAAQCLDLFSPIMNRTRFLSKHMWLTRRETSESVPRENSCISEMIISILCIDTANSNQE